jgi:Flp pilus assembly protein TadG
MMLRHRCRSFLRAEDGSATVEFAILVPAFLGLVLFAADTAASFTRQSNMLSVSQETARIVARHGLDAAGAAGFARDRLRTASYTPEVAVTLDEVHQRVTVVVTSATSEIAPFGFLTRAMSDTISVSVSQALEPI